MSEYFVSFYTFTNSWLLILVAALFIAVSIILRREWNTFQYWKLQGVDGPTPLPIFGNLLQIFFRQGILATKEYYEKYGKIFGLYERGRPTLSLAEPELLRYVLR
ncbi:cytochrome P450 3A8-like protein [Leptotrombidium deliense]|uniref:Cytochrome P450 3A8-like protein n=1 Tax=Leptotrombidium deliense TaxID=299467 RepID=A0A443S4R1_9ACAR|nr:cytochrome P450 3A8-like protein [Leptotrombidium deliense]